MDKIKMRKRFLYITWLSLIVMVFCNGCGNNKEEELARKDAGETIKKME